ncbi:neutral/alkaline non-lysosomal ceramidase N-terminal domain-containing protein [uncultured Cyclobacterium sp.]|uniref:neutral/alkaline non-lysosomal ceramidase N-terminal domain-containing protein n=1 Tax=uncultured Cyclobacterium sp. TaxID=453820 RepID=UPI0030ED629B|tara:strand:+ start:42239 stop:43603 length:1365 start_codon:yes stop_codon:yes gene_type:complete
MSNNFQAGAASVDITPPLGTIINGDFVTHYAQKVHDSLHAKALVLKNEETTLVIVVVDICIMGKELLDGTKAIIQNKFGISPEQVLISATHTHASGAVEEVHMVPADLAYRKRLPNLIVEAVEKALSQLKPAQIAFGKADAPEYVMCRRYWMKDSYTSLNPVTEKADLMKTNPFGVEDEIIKPLNTPDPELGFLAVKGLDEQWIALLGNYSLHYVGDWENGTISADYFGEFSNALKEKLGAADEFVGMMSNGTSGDINIWDFSGQKKFPDGELAKSKKIGNDLADKVVENLKNLEWNQEPYLNNSFALVKAGRRIPIRDELETASAILALGGLEDLKPDTEGWRKLYAREQMLLHEFAKAAESPVQVFHIGEGKIGALPGEFFAETGLKIKAEVNCSYFTISLANDNVGYVPPAHEIDKGGYETWRCRISNLLPEAEELFRKKLLELIHDNKNS